MGANYWNDPFHQSIYLTENIWLPYFNALPGGPCNATESARFGANLNRLKQLVLIGGPQDGPCALRACVTVCVRVSVCVCVLVCIWACVCLSVSECLCSRV